MALGPPPEEGTVTVVVRVRPSMPNERERAAHPVLRVLDQHILVFDPEEATGPSGSVPPFRGHKHQGKDLKFVFDRVFEEKATQEEVFQHTTREVLDSVLNGYNCSVFAYGATGAGKTYTMLGSEENPGIMYLTMVELYKRIEARKEEKSCEVLVSYQEVYNEQIHDLLEPKGPLAIREDPEKGVVVQGLSFHQPASAEQLLQMLANGNKNRTQHPTDANNTSSRSHAIFQIYVKQQDRVGGLARDLQVAKMSLVDLAGSERASVTNAKGERLREGANINRSLLALINVINALADAKSKKTHIPYRDSKLTRLLKDSIGGNCRTIMIAAVSPCALAYEDTYNTLKYANRAKEIKLLVRTWRCGDLPCVREPLGTGGKQPGVWWGTLVGASLPQLEFSSSGGAVPGRKRLLKLQMLRAWFSWKASQPIAQKGLGLWVYEHRSRSLEPGGHLQCQERGPPHPSAALTSPLSLSLQLKSNVLSFDCHNSKCAAMCKQLKAEVRRWQGGQDSVFSRGLLGTETSELLGGGETIQATAGPSLQVADLQAKLRAYEDAAQPAESQAPAAALTSSPVELPR
uniref:Kinesin-like protein n=1 Tax=Calidris pygmaea TaxID=425635 RepID=A0A8C3KM29_9CHAR